jgi:error-prone DNA polymerase
VIFMTLEDETGIANTIVWARAFEQFRPVVLGARLVAVTGPVQNASGVIHIVTEQIDDLTPMLRQLSEDHGSLNGLARADEGRPPVERHRHPRSGDALVTLFKDQPTSRSDIAVQTAKVMPKGRNFH